MPGLKSLVSPRYLNGSRNRLNQSLANAPEPRILYHLLRPSSLRRMVVTLASEPAMSPARIGERKGSNCEEASSACGLGCALAIRLPSDESPADHHRPPRKVCDLQARSGSVCSGMG